MLDLDKFVTEHDAILRSAAFAVFERDMWSQGEQSMEAARAAREEKSFKRSLYVRALIGEVRQVAGVPDMERR